MYEDKTIGVVVPCYNEETQVGKVLETMPDFVDCIIVVDDCSSDGTAEVVDRHIESEGENPRTILIRLEVNSGVGAAIMAGYEEAMRREVDVSAVMAGDGQMPPDELGGVIEPVCRGQADYVKGNRLFYRDAWQTIPRLRYLGNAFLSMLTKIASGYWHVADSQTGYTAISLHALKTIELEGIYPRYGYPNDMLCHLNVYDMRVADVPIRPCYNVGEQSKMRLWKVIPTMSWLIFKRFCWRMWRKYVIRDFHPLVLFYLAGFLLTALGLAFFVRMIWVWIDFGTIPPLNALVWTFCMVSSAQFMLFAMWFDMENCRDLKVNLPPS